MIFAKISSDFRIKICFSATYHLEDIFLHGRLGLNHNFRKVAIKVTKNRRKINFVLTYFNSKAAGWDSIGSKIEFWGRPYFWISCTIFRYYPGIHFYTHFWNQNSQKIRWHHKNSFSKAALSRVPSDSLANIWPR